MKPWTKDDLTLFYYGELSDKQRRALITDMANDTVLQQQYAELSAFLDNDVAIEVPPPSEQLNQRIMASIYQQVEIDAQQQTTTAQEKPASFWSNWQWGRTFATAAGLCTVVLTTFYLGRMSVDVEKPIASLPTQAEQHNEQDLADIGRRVMLSNLSQHLQSTDRLFTQVSNSDTSMAAQLQERKQTINEMVALNRIYRRMAEQNNDKQLADVLLQMEQVLLSLKHAEPTQDQQQWNSLRERIDNNDLLFRLRVTNSALQSI